MQSFYDWWLDRTRPEDTDYTTRPELAPAFVKALKDASGTPFQIEPFLCVQDGPIDSVEAGPATISRSTAAVIITFTLVRQLTRQVDLGLGPDGWQITAVRCDLITSGLTRPAA